MPPSERIEYAPRTVLRLKRRRTLLSLEKDGTDGRREGQTDGRTDGCQTDALRLPLDAASVINGLKIVSDT